ncbi:iron-containing alcohol dehydrogenase family protein [Sutcliffiella halmapala]|uniref:iron-containing alcohol dehydrogenase family protein n=1 Tax=Sutcliffiella halmapala TaxID=79882 RepID=UPI001473C64B|nr:iron-containing alcohol dehydrogenase family protein [Sutcliffiella halmapala]
MINVQGAPTIYQSEVGVLARLPSSLARENYQRLYIVHGTKSLHSVKSHLPKFDGFQVHFEHYSGECSKAEVLRLKEEAEKFNADIIIGIGGGKIMDLSKALGYEMKKEVVLIPTLASTCAAWTPLSVFYTDKGNFLQYIIYPKSTYMVLVEPEVILKAPIEFFRAGIGDTLAKWYEAKSLIYKLETVPVAVQIGLQAAELCKKILINESVQALTDISEGKLTHSVRAVTDATIMLGGMVGGFADYYGRIAGAHSVHNALTHLPFTHHLLHGEKVAYGILIQLALERDFQEIEELLVFYEKIGLPKKLIDLGLSTTSIPVLETIAQKTLHPSESIHFMKETFSEKDVVEALQELEKINEKKKERV